MWTPKLWPLELKELLKQQKHREDESLLMRRPVPWGHAWPGSVGIEALAGSSDEKFHPWFKVKVDYVDSSSDSKIEIVGPHVLICFDGYPIIIPSLPIVTHSSFVEGGALDSLDPHLGRYESSQAAQQDSKQKEKEAAGLVASSIKT